MKLAAQITLDQLCFAVDDSKMIMITGKTMSHLEGK